MKRLNFFSLILMTWASAASAYDANRPAMNDLQIDWVLPSGATFQAAPSSTEGELNISYQAVPRRLFVASVEIVSQSGKKLTPAGAQFYPMIGSPVMVCSQSSALSPYLAERNRVCLVDSDNDNFFESYFLRSFGKSFLSTDEMWFAMNAHTPEKMDRIDTLKLTEIDRKNAIKKLSVNINVRMNSKKDQLLSSILFDNNRSFLFYGKCTPDGGDSISGENFFLCGVPQLRFSVSAMSGVEAPAATRVIPPSRDVGVRFWVAARLMGTRLMDSASFE